MATFFKKHIDQSLVAVTIALIAVLAGFFAWSLIDLAGQINQIISFSPTASQGSDFDLKAAAALDLRGLVATQAPTTTPPVQ